MIQVGIETALGLWNMYNKTAFCKMKIAAGLYRTLSCFWAFSLWLLANRCLDSKISRPMLYVTFYLLLSCWPTQEFGHCIQILMVIFSFSYFNRDDMSIVFLQKKQILQFAVYKKLLELKFETCFNCVFDKNKKAYKDMIMSSKYSFLMYQYSIDKSIWQFLRVTISEVQTDNHDI